MILWILWITLFKPTVESAAKDAVAAPLASLNEKVDALAPTTVAGGGGGGGATTTTVPVGGGGGGATTTTLAGGGVGHDGADGDDDHHADVDVRHAVRQPADFQLGVGRSWPPAAHRTSTTRSAPRSR